MRREPFCGRLIEVTVSGIALATVASVVMTLRLSTLYPQQPWPTDASTMTPTRISHDPPKKEVTTITAAVQEHRSTDQSCTFPNQKHRLKFL